MHPLVNILIYITILLTMGFLPVAIFWLFFITLSLLAVYLQNKSLQKKSFLRQLLKLKWLFLSIFVIYAFGTPGEFISDLPSYYLPTKEGLYLGMLQVAKLIIALSALSLLFYKKETAELIQGLTLLLSPLKRLNFNVNQFSVRLLLTLHYVNAMTQLNRTQLNTSPLKSKKLLFSELHLAAQQQPQDADLNIVHLQQKPFTRLDFFVLIMLLVYLMMIIQYAQ